MQSCDSCSIRSAIKWSVLFLLVFIFVQYFFNLLVTSKYAWIDFVRNNVFISDNETSSIKDMIQAGLLRHDNEFLPSSTNVTRPIAATAATQPCPLVPPNRVGHIAVNMTPPILKQLELKHPELGAGGTWHPTSCRARYNVAIIIPFRDRDVHLRIFLQHMHPFLQGQQLHYAIYIVEEVAKVQFNRAMLMNIGFHEASKIYDYDCYIFHDVDLLPEDDRNIYSCPDQPRHMSAAIDTMNYRLPYSSIFGGVSAMKKEHVLKINGFSNKFFGWGGEDDDLYNRVRDNGLRLIRYPMDIARYKMILHKKDKPSPQRYKYLYSGKLRYKNDGINSLLYHRLDLQKRKLYTWIYVSINETQVIANPTAYSQR